MLHSLLVQDADSSPFPRRAAWWMYARWQLYQIKNAHSYICCVAFNLQKTEGAGHRYGTWWQLYQIKTANFHICYSGCPKGYGQNATCILKSC